MHLALAFHRPSCPTPGRLASPIPSARPLVGRRIHSRARTPCFESSRRGHRADQSIYGRSCASLRHLRSQRFRQRPHSHRAQLVHTAQYERFGSVAAFLRQYLHECLSIGYPDAPMEAGSHSHVRTSSPCRHDTLSPETVRGKDISLNNSPGIERESSRDRGRKAAAAGSHRSIRRSPNRQHRTACKNITSTDPARLVKEKPARRLRCSMGGATHLLPALSCANLLRAGPVLV